MTTHRRIGGTSVAALFHEDSFGKTPLDIYNRIVHGYSGVQNRYMARGLAMENTIRGLYVAVNNVTLDPHPGVVLWGECFAASVDDLARKETPGVVDYKSASIKSKSKWRKGPLTTYEWQLHLYMMVFQRPWADLFVAFGTDEWEADGVTFKAFHIENTETFHVFRDLEREKRILEVGQTFWREHVVPRVPPGGLISEHRSEIVRTPLTQRELEALAEMEAEHVA